MRSTVRSSWTAFAATAALALSFLGATSSRAEPPPTEAARERYNLSPAYVAKESFRVRKRYRQSTITDAPVGYFGGKNLNFSDYDAYLDIDVLVTVEEVDAKGDAQVWSALFERFRFDMPNPLESTEARALHAEGKRQGEERDAHPLEGETVKFDRSGPKTRIYKVLKNGEDAGITTRFPELLPIMQSVVEPDWVPVDSVPVGGEWEMPADTIFRLTRVLTREPLKGVLKCKLASVSDQVAVIELRAVLGEEFRRVRMDISGKGRIVVDLKRRHPAKTEFQGEVQISSKTSNLRGTGTVIATTEWLPVMASPAAK